ncbi:MAG: DUF814 domain-containing protein [candidate division Zixibacteria bacterium]|nr:DUF814 domain-containing protein [candidate division Zixibacteria bacterium]
MKKQRLSALDINILAIELNNLLKNSIIESITSIGQRLKFRTDKVDFAFVILSGNPYIINDCKSTDGSPRFRNLIGGKIIGVKQINDDRIVRLEIIAFNKLGLRKKYNLYFELYGSGNVILTDESDIVRGTLRGAANSPIGRKFQLPQNSDNNLLDTIRNIDNQPKLPRLVDKSKILPFNQIENDNETLMQILKKAVNHPATYLLKDSSGNPCGFSVAGPPFKEGVDGIKKNTLFEAITECVEFWSETVLNRGAGENPQTHLKKAQSKLKAIQDELTQAENASLYRQYGEIILANLGLIKKGMTKFRCGNPYSPTNDFIEIPLVASLSPEKNAAIYFEKARKMESSIEILKRRLSNQQQKIEELERIITSPHSDQEHNEPQTKQSQKTAAKLPFHQIDLPDGWRVYIGKSAVSNDELTFSFARKDDIWFHAWQAAGSHVILRRPNKGDIPPKEFLIRAAELAAYNSKAKTSSKVPVIYTEARYVRKVKGVPGKVTVTNEKQLMVKPTGPDKSVDQN